MSTSVLTRTLLTVTEAAELLRVSERTVRRLVTSGELPAVRVRRAIRIDRDELEAWLYEGDAA